MKLRKPSAFLQRVNIICHTPLFECLQAILDSTYYKEHFSTTHAYLFYGTLLDIMYQISNTQKIDFFDIHDTKMEEEHHKHGIYEHYTHWDAEGKHKLQYSIKKLFSNLSFCSISTR